MEFVEQEAEIYDPSQVSEDAQGMPQYYDPEEYAAQAGASQGSGYGMFAQGNDLRVIQEYNHEEGIPALTKRSMWGLASKSIKLGFWNEQDIQQIFLHKNLIKVGHIMANPKHKYSFEDRNNINQMDLLVYADFKRGVGMEKYKINERTLQATSVTQNIQGGGTMGGKRGGVLSGIKSFFA